MRAAALALLVLAFAAVPATGAPSLTVSAGRAAITSYALKLHEEGATHYDVAGCERSIRRLVYCGYALIGRRAGRPFECVGTAVAVARRRRIQVIPFADYGCKPWISTRPRAHRPKGRRWRQ